MRIVIWWSFFTAATGWVKGCRRLSLFERCSEPARRAAINLTKAFTWLPQDERVRAKESPG
jgi:hypothetical protein